jgi:hypothetical protein
MMTYSSFCALFRPSFLAELSGIPFNIQSSSPKAEDKTQAFLIQFAGREFALTAIIGILVYLDEITVLSWVLLVIGVVGVWKVHFYLTILTVVVAPLGLLLGSSS